MFICLLDLQLRSRFLCTFYMFGSVRFWFGKQNFDWLVLFGSGSKTLLRSVTTLSNLSILKQKKDPTLMLTPLAETSMAFLQHLLHACTLLGLTWCCIPKMGSNQLWRSIVLKFGLFFFSESTFLNRRWQVTSFILY